MQSSREGSGHLDDHDEAGPTKIAKTKIARQQGSRIPIHDGEIVEGDAKHSARSARCASRSRRTQCGGGHGEVVIAEG
jgi:hypothetical protein